MTTAGATALGYDGRGNLASSGGTTYSYTSENRLATGNGYIMTYDPLGRYYWISNGTASAWMQYDGGNIIEERGASGVLRRYVFGPGDDSPLVWYEGSGTTDRRWLIPDERGSIIAVTNASGAAIAVNTYDEYGIPGAGNLGRFQYTGQARIPELGLYYYKARMYSPTLGRFMQTDPIGYGDGINWYAYVANDPVNGRDPSGMCGPATPACVAVGRCAINTACRTAVVSGVRWAIREVVKQLTTTTVVSPMTKPDAEAERPKETAKERRERQRQEATDRRDAARGGSPDGGGTPGNNQAQNKQFDNVVKESNLTADQARQLHEEVTGQDMNRDQIMERAREMFVDKPK